MKVDSHLHISIFEDNAKSLEKVFELLNKDMEKNGIDYAIIIPDNVEKLPDVVDLEKAQKLIGKSNKFFLLGSPQIVQRGSSEIEKYKKLLEGKLIRGIKFFPGHDPFFPTDERCLPYYKLCSDFNVPVLFHTGENSGDQECSKWNDPMYIVEIAKQFPELKIIIAHYFWPKMSYCYEITKNISNIYFDTSAMADEEVIEKSGGIEKVKEILKKTINDCGDKVIFGTDWPMCKTEKHIDLIKSLGLTKEIEEKIFYKNAKNVYKLPVV